MHFSCILDIDVKAHLETCMPGMVQPKPVHAVIVLDLFQWTRWKTTCFTLNNLHEDFVDLLLMELVVRFLKVLMIFMHHWTLEVGSNKAQIFVTILYNFLYCISVVKQARYFCLNGFALTDFCHYEPTLCFWILWYMQIKLRLFKDYMKILWRLVWCTVMGLK